MNKSDFIISMKNVKKIYSNNYIETHALKDLNFDIKEGEFIVIMGKSGSGKTTLLNVISGLIGISSGEIKFKDKVLQDLNDENQSELRQHSIGFIFQFYNLHENLTAFENLELPMIISNAIPKQKRREKSLELLNLVGLKDRGINFPHELSGGEKQRVGIARALSNNPELILADEPTGDLDSITAGEILDLLIKLNSNMKKTILLVTHDPTILRPGMRFIYLEDGNIKEDLIVTDEFNRRFHLKNELLIDQLN